jgi:hypothetical protein
MYPGCQDIFWGHQQPHRHNKQESTTFILPYGLWIKQTALYGQGRVSLALWCHAGLVFLKFESKISDGSRLMFAHFLGPPTATGT